MSPRKRREPAAAARSRAPRAEPIAAPPAAATAAPANVLWAALIVLALARAALSFVPTMAVWGLNLNRFLSPVVGWGLWAVAAAALVPPIARVAVRGVAAAGDAIARRPKTTGLVAALFAIVLVLAFPDRVRYMGDFLIRQGSVEESIEPAKVYPQALPLDVLLHYRLPWFLDRAGVLSPNTSARVLGALEAAALALAAVALARALALRGAAAFAVAAVAFFGGALGMFTGYNKAVVDVCVLAALAAVAGLAAVRTGRGLLGFGLAIGLAVALHRSALALLPGAIVVWAWWLRAHARGGAWRRPANLLGFAIPLVALAVVMPKIVHTLMTVDMPVHIAPAISKTEGGMLRSAFAGTRPLDLGSLMLMLSPLAFAIPFLVVAFGRRWPRPAEALLLAVFALPFVAVIPFIHATNGLYRDWDNFAAAGTTLCVLAAWLVGEALRDGTRPWLAVAVAAGVAVPSVQWIAHHADLDRGLARMTAFMSEPPPRSGTDRATTWDFIGSRNYQVERFAEAAVAFGHATETAPSPRMLLQHALALTQSGDLTGARNEYRRMIALSPKELIAWRGVAAMSERLGDWEEARRAALRLNEIYPNHPDAVGILRAYEQREARRAAAAADPATGR